MRKYSAVVAFLVLLFPVCQVVTAAEVIRVDPNTLPREEQKTFWDLDPRLDQKVTLDARRKTVLAIMNELTKMTGVTLNSGYNSHDWQVRDRKMIIIAKDMPLKDLMQSIARTMKFKWFRSEGEPYTYRIYMDRRVLLEAEGQAYRAEQNVEELVIKRREALAERMAEVADVDPAELDKMRDTDPYTYALAKSGFAGSMAQFLQLVPEAREAFVNKSQAWFSGQQLSEEAHSAAASIAQAMLKFSSGESPDPSNEIDGLVEVLKFEFNTSPHTRTDPIGHRNSLGTITLHWRTISRPDAYTINSSQHSQDFELVDPENSMGKSRGFNMLSLLEREPGSPDPEPVRVDMPMEEWVQLRNESDFGEPVVKHEPEEYEVFAAEKLKNVTYTTTEEWMAAFTEATGMNVVSDYLGKSMTQMSPRLGYAASNWWRHGNTLEFRDRYWFRKRSLQIPESYIEPWREHFKESGTLEIDDLAQIAVLIDTQEKYEVNINGDEILGNDSMRQALFQQLRPLRLYGSFNEKQQAALLSDNGLNQDSLTTDQWEYFSSFSVIDDSKEPLRMTITRSPGRNDYRITKLFNSLEITVFSVWTPKYEPPKEVDKVSVSGKQETAP